MSQGYPAAQDTWGAISIPTQPGYSFTPVAQSLWVSPAEIPVADPCLAVILDYLATACNTDQILQAAWDSSRSAAASRPVSRIFSHPPADVVFNVAHLPALYMWREDGRQEYAADDWLRDIARVMALWVFPLGAQERQRSREPFLNALAKGLSNTIERGRTPSWKQPGDTDPISVTDGTLFYPYAGFESFVLKSYKRTKLIVPKQEADVYPAIELTFELVEKQDLGLSRYAALSGIATSLTLYDATGVAPWTPVTTYAGGAQVYPPGGNGYVYTCTTPGTSGLVAPVFPTTINATVQEQNSALVWTCAALMAPNGNQTQAGPL